jgi:tRNA A-37 threonylcarbamoyl transferase component Bud32
MRLSNDPLLGATVGRYRLARSIGRGGMGEVYLGVQPSIHSRVAIKVLHDTAMSRAVVDRFFAEARAVNVIRHENIVSIIDLDVLPDGRPYIIMEYLEGSALSARLESGPQLGLEDVVRLGSDVADALEAAHARGIVHRDLKPDNVFITQAGRVKVLDFGVAKLAPDVNSMQVETRTGALVGTPHYMSPEQAMGLEAGPPSDVYSLGLLIYEALTRRRAFDGDTLYELLKKHVEEQPPKIRALRPEVPPALEAVVERALAKKASERYQSAAEVRQALRVALPNFSDSRDSLGGSRPGTGPGTPLAPTITDAPRTPPGYAAPITADPQSQPRKQGHAAGWALGIGATFGAILLLLVAVAVVGGAFFMYRPAAKRKSAALPPQPSLQPTEAPGSAMPAGYVGSYAITSGRAPDGTNYTGEVLVTERASRQLSLSWIVPNSPTLNGVAVLEGDVVCAGWAAHRAYGVVVYRIVGNRLVGEWTTATGTSARLGTEELEGPKGLNGTYRIISSAEPITGKGYTGKVSITPRGEVYDLQWTLPREQYSGIGIREGNLLVVGWGAAGSGVMVYSRKDGKIRGRWAQMGTKQNRVGSEELTRK